MCKASPPRIGEGVFKPLHEIWPLEDLAAKQNPQHRKYRSGGRYFRPALLSSVNGLLQTHSIPQGRKCRSGGRYFRLCSSTGATSGPKTRRPRASSTYKNKRKFLRNFPPEVGAEVPLWSPELPVARYYRCYFRCKNSGEPGESSTQKNKRNWLRNCPPEVASGSTAGPPVVPVARYFGGYFRCAVRRRPEVLVP